MIRSFRALSPFVFGLGLTALSPGAPAADDPATDHSREPIAPIKAPFAMPDLQRPVFPDRTVDIRDFGAVADGSTQNTAAFAKAIDACARAGGGHVNVPAGRWLTGPIHLRSRIDLHLAAGAEIVFSDRPEDYLPPVFVRIGGIEAYNYSPLVYARDCENIAVTGPGKLDGNGQAWWAWAKKGSSKLSDMSAKGVPVEKRVFGTPQSAIRPNFVSFVNCKNVLLEGFTVGSGPMWTLHPVYCENIVIRYVTIDTHGPNNDGIDLDSCRNALVEHCTFRTGDDCLVLKSGYNEDGWRVGRPTENVVMRDCFASEGHGGLVIGSEMSGDVRNVYVRDCEFQGTDRAVRIKSMRGRGGVVENVWAENLKATNIQHEIVVLNMDYGSDHNPPSNSKAPTFRNMTLRHITGDGARTAILITGLEDSPVQNIRFEDIDLRAKKGVVASHVTGLNFDGVRVTPDKGPAFELTEACNVVVRRATASPGKDAFLKLEGTGSGDVRIEASDLSGVGRPFTLGAGVAADAVKVQ